MLIKYLLTHGWRKGDFCRVCPSVAWREGGGHVGEKSQQDKGDMWKQARCVEDSNSTWLGGEECVREWK